MLSYLRKNAGSWLIKVMLVGIALTFIIGFGILPSLRDKEGPGGVVAKVGSRVITRGDWDRTYEGMYRFYQEMYKERFSEEMAKQLQLRESALDTLINRTLQLEEAERLKIKVSDQEVQTRIRALPYFQRDGKFSLQLYQYFLRQSNLTPAEFEQLQREEIQIERIEQLVQGTVKLSDEELWDQYQLENEEIELSALKLDARDFESSVQVTDAGLREYFQKNVGQFLRPEKVKAKYVRLDAARFRDQAEVHTGDIEEYYEAHSDQFSRPEAVHLRHILLKLQPGEDEAVVRKKTEVLLGLRESVGKGEDFAALAKINSEDATAAKGGELGFVQRGDLTPEVEKAAFSLKAGEVSEVIRSATGLHLLKVEEHREEHLEPLDQVKESIRDKLKEEAGWHLARREAEDIIRSSRAAGTLEVNQGGERAGLAVQETGYLARGEGMEDLPAEAIGQQVFPLEVGDISPALRGGQGYCLFQLLERKAPEAPPFEEVKEAVEKQYRVEKSKELARNRAEQLAQKLAKGGSIEDIGKEAGLAPFDTGYFNRLRSYVPKIGQSAELVENAFFLTQEHPVVDRAIEVGGSCYIVQLKQRRSPDRNAYVAEKETFRSVQQQQKTQEVFREWLAELRARQNVEVLASS